MKSSCEQNALLFVWEEQKPLRERVWLYKVKVCEADKTHAMTLFLVDWRLNNVGKENTNTCMFISDLNIW